LEAASEANTVSAVAGFMLFLLKVILDLIKLVNSPEGTLDTTPPPFKYLTVKVVFEGDIP